MLNLRLSFASIPPVSGGYWHKAYSWRPPLSPPPVKLSSAWSPVEVFLLSASGAEPCCLRSASPSADFNKILTARQSLSLASGVGIHRMLTTQNARLCFGALPALDSKPLLSLVDLAIINSRRLISLRLLSDSCNTTALHKHQVVFFMSLVSTSYL